MDDDATYTAFVGEHLLVSGSLKTLLQETKRWLDRDGSDPICIFDDKTGCEVDFNFQGTLADVLAREVPTPTRAGPGRPKLGVVSREVSMLPRHWEWLERQPNGISAALRRLVEEAKKRDPRKERARLVTEAASRVMSVMAGNRPGYEEASRALFSGDRPRFEELIRKWPDDIRKHLLRLVSAELRGEVRSGL